MANNNLYNAVAEKMDEVSRKLEGYRAALKNKDFSQWSENTCKTQRQQLSVKFDLLWAIRELLKVDGATLPAECEKRLRELCVLSETRATSKVEIIVNDGDDFTEVQAKYSKLTNSATRVWKAMQEKNLMPVMENGKYILRDQTKKQAVLRKKSK